MTRASFKRMLKHRCRIRRFSSSGTDRYNQSTGSYAAVALNQPCLLQQRRTLATTGRRQGLTDAAVNFQDVLFVSYGANVREGDRIDNIVFEGTTTYLRKDTDGSQVTFDVVEVIDAGGQGHHLEVKLKAVV